MQHKIKACSKLGVAIAAAMGLAGQAEAAVDLDTTPVTPATFASEIGTATATLANTNNILDLTFTPVAHELNGADADNVYFLKIELANKATFQTAPTLTCYGKAMTAGEPATGFAAALRSGGNGTSFVMFEYFSGGHTNTNNNVLSAVNASACTMVANTYGFSGTTDKTVTVTNLAKDALGNLTAQKTFSNQPFISFANGLDATAASANVTISVTAASQKFAGNKTTAQLGTAQFGAANGTQHTAGGADDAEAKDFVTAASVTLSGAPLSPSISFSTAKSGIYLVSAGKNCGAPPVKSKYDSSTGNSVTFTGLTPGQISAGVQACVVVDGSTIIPEGTVTVSISPGLKDAKNVVSLNFENTTVGNYKKNGDSATAFLITKPGAVDVTYLRITNNSSLSGTVRITLYGEDGSTLGTAGASLGTWNANETKLISSQDIANAVGVSTWTGRARAVIDAELSDIVVLDLVRTNDVLTNQSSIQD